MPGNWNNSFDSSLFKTHNNTVKTIRKLPETLLLIGNIGLVGSAVTLPGLHGGLSKIVYLYGEINET